VPQTDLGIDLTIDIGIGSEVKYISLLPEVAAKSITLRCDARLQNIVEQSMPKIKTIAHGAQFPANIEQVIDYAGLGLLTRSSKNSFKPAEKYLIENSVLAQQIRKKYKNEFSNKTLVGISWHTSNKNTSGTRNVDLQQLVSKLGANNNFAFISLLSSLPEAKKQIDNAGLQNDVFIDSSIDPRQDMDEYLAQIAAMDFIVTIDCSVVHFAGALGVPTYMIASKPQIWKWPRSGNNSYWHESVKILSDIKELTDINKHIKAKLA
jgi:ADP-heptose:LPS heptosyltransferase